MLRSSAFAASFLALFATGSNTNIYLPDGYAVGVGSQGLPAPVLVPVPAQLPEPTALFSTFSSIITPVTNIDAAATPTPASSHPGNQSGTQAEVGYTPQTGVAAEQFSLASASAVSQKHSSAYDHNGATAETGTPGSPSSELGRLSGDQPSDHSVGSLSSKHNSASQLSSEQGSGAQSAISANGMAAALLIIGTVLAATTSNL